MQWSIRGLTEQLRKGPRWGQSWGRARRDGADPAPHLRAQTQQKEPRAQLAEKSQEAPTDPGADEGLAATAETMGEGTGPQLAGEREGASAPCHHPGTSLSWGEQEAQLSALPFHLGTEGCRASQGWEQLSSAGGNGCLGKVHRASPTLLLAHTHTAGAVCPGRASCRGFLTALVPWLSSP